MNKKSLKQIAYISIKDKILNCEYKPNSFLNEDLLCEQFDMSRTPIRDALSRMEQERLITIIPKKGFFVSPINIEDINTVFEGRILIEPYIILNYCNKISDEILYKFEKLINYDKLKEYSYRVDDEFHCLIVSQCKNPYLINAYDDISNQNYRLRVFSSRNNNKRIIETKDEHISIFENIKNGRLEEASQLMKIHLINSKKSSLEAFLREN